MLPSTPRSRSHAARGYRQRGSDSSPADRRCIEMDNAGGGSPRPHQNRRDVRGGLLRLPGKQRSDASLSAQPGWLYGADSRACSGTPSSASCWIPTDEAARASLSSPLARGAGRPRSRPWAVGHTKEAARGIRGRAKRRIDTSAAVPARPAGPLSRGGSSYHHRGQPRQSRRQRDKLKRVSETRPRGLGR